MQTRNLALWSLALTLAFVVPDALAGTGGSAEFSAVYTLLTDWMQGIMGRIIAVTFIIVGLVAGVVRGSIMGFVLGVAAGLGIFTSPTVVDNIVTAVL